MIKKTNLPAMPFYIGDWKKDPGIQVLTREQKMIWFEMLMLMWESAERGYLTINNRPITDQMLAVALNLDNQTLSKTLTWFEELGLFSRRESDGAIYSRKQVEIIELSEKRKNAGTRGGNPNLLNQGLTKRQARGLPNTETETINETVISNKGLMEEPSLEEVVHYFTESGHPKEMGESFHSYYSAQDWKTTSGVSIKKRWQNKVIGWLNNQKEFNKNGINKGNKPRGSIDFNKYESELATIKPRSTELATDRNY